MMATEVDIIVVVLVGVLGLLVGSFLNVVIYRVPVGKSIVAPPSSCPTCGSQIKPWDNVPVVSWLLLRAKCRRCGEMISVRYPLVELATGVLFAAIAIRFPAPLSAPAEELVAAVLLLVALLYFAAIGIALGAIDLDTQRLPNALVLPSYVVVAILLSASSVVTGDLTSLFRAGVGGAALLAAYFLMAMVYPGGMGFGDVKLAGVIGMLLGYLGWGALVFGSFSAFLLGGIFGVALLIGKRANRKSGIPFGPWMLAGAWLGIFIGERGWNWYLGLFELA